VVGVATRIDLSEDHQRIVSAGIALGAVAPTPLLARDAGNFLVGKAPVGAVFEVASALAQAAARPISDLRGSMAFRTHLVGVLARRAMEAAAGRARKEGPVR